MMQFKVLSVAVMTEYSEQDRVFDMGLKALYEEYSKLEGRLSPKNYDSLLPKIKELISLSQTLKRDSRFLSQFDRSRELERQGNISADVIKLKLDLYSAIFYAFHRNVPDDPLSPVLVHPDLKEWIVTNWPKDSMNNMLDFYVNTSEKPLKEFLIGSYRERFRLMVDVSLYAMDLTIETEPDCFNSILQGLRRFVDAGIVDPSSFYHLYSKVEVPPVKGIEYLTEEMRDALSKPHTTTARSGKKRVQSTDKSAALRNLIHSVSVCADFLGLQNVLVESYMLSVDLIGNRVQHKIKPNSKRYQPSDISVDDFNLVLRLQKFFSLINGLNPSQRSESDPNYFDFFLTLLFDCAVLVSSMHLIPKSHQNSSNQLAVNLGTHSRSNSFSLVHRITSKLSDPKSRICLPFLGLLYTVDGQLEPLSEDAKMQFPEKFANDLQLSELLMLAILASNRGTQSPECACLIALVSQGYPKDLDQLESIFETIGSLFVGLDLLVPALMVFHRLENWEKMNQVFEKIRGYFGLHIAEFFSADSRVHGDYELDDPQIIQALNLLCIGGTNGEELSYDQMVENGLFESEIRDISLSRDCELQFEKGMPRLVFRLGHTVSLEVDLGFYLYSPIKIKPEFFAQLFCHFAHKFGNTLEENSFKDHFEFFYPLVNDSVKSKIVKALQHLLELGKISSFPESIPLPAQQSQPERPATAELAMQSTTTPIEPTRKRPKQKTRRLSNEGSSGTGSSSAASVALPLEDPNPTVELSPEVQQKLRFIAKVTKPSSMMTQILALFQESGIQGSTTRDGQNHTVIVTDRGTVGVPARHEDRRGMGHNVRSSVMRDVKNILNPK